MNENCQCYLLLLRLYSLQFTVHCKAAAKVICSLEFMELLHCWQSLTCFNFIAMPYGCPCRRSSSCGHSLSVGRDPSHLSQQSCQSACTNSCGYRKCVPSTEFAATSPAVCQVQALLAGWNFQDTDAYKASGFALLGGMNRKLQLQRHKKDN